MQTQTLVIKIASRCNINCTYCYMYNLEDKSYVIQPKFMSPETVGAMMEQVNLHCLTHGLEQFTFVLHGGEPLLASKKFFTDFVEIMQKVMNPTIKCIIQVQTNGILLTEEWCQLFSKLHISIGISIDGNKPTHDKYRLDHQGNGTYDKVLKGIRCAQNFFKNKDSIGILSVINVESDPIEEYYHYKNVLQVRGLDLLIPEATYDKHSYTLDKDHTPYADWLITIFDLWFQEKDNDRLDIRMFIHLMFVITGGEYSADNFGSQNNEVLVIETNGAIEAVDVLKACGQNFTKNNCNVADTTLDQAMETDLAAMYHFSHSWLPRKCLACPVKDICGSGYIPHRYSSKNGFNNPSIYCHDLLKLITHIQNKIFDELPDNIIEASQAVRFTYQDALKIIDETLPSIPEPDYLQTLERFRKEEYAEFQ